MADPVVRHFLLCQRVRYDHTTPDAPYSAENVVYRYHPPSGYPVVVPRFWTFITLIGTGTHEFWIEVVYRGQVDDDGNAPGNLVGSYGPYVAHFGGMDTLLTRGWSVRAVPFDRPGWYEFQLLLRGVVLAAELIDLED